MIPQVDAFTHGAHAVLWCPYCTGWHTHGAGDWHHAAHCYRPSPWQRGGYHLVSIGLLPAFCLTPRGTLRHLNHALRDRYFERIRDHGRADLLPPYASAPEEGTPWPTQ